MDLVAGALLAAGGSPVVSGSVVALGAVVTLGATVGSLVGLGDTPAVLEGSPVARGAVIAPVPLGGGCTAAPGVAVSALVPDGVAVLVAPKGGVAVVDVAAPLVVTLPVAIIEAASLEPDPEPA